MARVTVEDCLENVGNRFDLVMLASRRSRQIANGREPQVQPGMDKPTVLALREIADNLINPEFLEKEEELVAEARAAAEAAAALALQVQAVELDDDEPL